jgi:hypothetical protein
MRLAQALVRLISSLAFLVVDHSKGSGTWWLMVKEHFHQRDCEKSNIFCRPNVFNPVTMQLETLDTFEAPRYLG